MVCPHGVIRPYLLSEEEYESAPDYIKERCKEAILQDIRVASVTEVLVVKDKFVNNACNVSFVLTTVDNKELSSGTLITVY